MRIMHLCRETFCLLVVLESHNDTIVVLTEKNFIRESNLLIPQHCLGKCTQSFEELNLHSAADGIMSLDLEFILTVHEEMATDHVQVHVPDFPVRHNLMVDLSKGESVSHVSHSAFAGDSGFLVLDLLLAFHHSNYHSFCQLECGGGM